jgi:hypothetical protein
LTDAEIKYESFLEACNSMLATGEIPGLFVKEDRDLIPLKQAWNFTSCQHGVASFKERFILNFGISQDEGNSTTLWTCDVVEFLNILLELRITVGFVESDLEEGLSANE